jgi:diguanylate cyclase
MYRIRKVLDRLTAAMGLVIAAGIGIAAFYWAGFAAPLDADFRVARDLSMQRAASGNVQIVEIDSRSIKQLENWPWKRRIHGSLVDHLSKAGVKTVAFDVDFSSPSNLIDDTAFADALKRFGGSAILPTFRQLVSDTDKIYVENVPIDQLREHAFLGSVNVNPDADGTMRTFARGTVTAGTARPSLAALLAEKPGTIEDSFRLSSSIDPETIPRYSASDILEGRVPDQQLAGKTILIGATAIELGDRYAVDGRGIIPGVVVQAIAAETLIQGLDNPTFGAVPALIIMTIGILFAARKRSLRGRLARLGATAVLISVFPFGPEILRVGSFDIALALLGLFSASVAAIVIDNVRRLTSARMTDAETGLPNQRAFAAVHEQAELATIVVMQVKSFNSIAVLLNVTERVALYDQMLGRVRTAVGERPFYKLGEGQLGWAMPGVEPVELTEILDGLAALFMAKLPLGRHEIVAVPAFGVAVQTAESPTQAIVQAELAVNTALVQGHRWVIYGDEMANSAEFSQRMLAEVDDAVANGNIFPVYQPKWSVKERRIVGVEALLRWDHPEKGAIRPDQFIPVLEANNRMADVSLYVFDCCARQAADWAAQGHDVKIAINVSAPLFADTAFTKDMIARVKAAGETAKQLMIEITESAVVTNTESTIATLNMLRAFGLGVSIDDYGTGQSTLSYLKRFPADELKIDQSFVSRMLDSKSDQILVRSTIELAHELGFSVVAEGVEDQACFDKLVEFDCDIIQGWHISRPKSAADVSAMLNAAPLTAAA